MPDLVVSRFTLVEHLPGDMAGLYNTLTGNLGALPWELWRALPGRLPDKDRWLNDLLEKGFLVDSALDEDLALTHFRRIRMYGSEDLGFLVRINRESEGEFQAMDGDVARKVLDFIQRTIRERAPLAVGLELVGPGPLLTENPAMYLAEGLYRFCSGSGLPLKVGAEFEGLEAERRNLARLKDFGLQELSIALSASAKGPVRGLSKALEGTPDYVKVRVWVCFDPDRNEEERLAPILESLNSEVGSGRLSEVQVVGVQSGTPLALRRPRPDCRFETKGIFASRSLDLMTRIGLPGPPFPPEVECPVVRRNRIFINPEGSLAACPLLGKSGFIGHAATGVNMRLEAAFSAGDLSDKCRRECPSAPICDGGCRAASLNWDAEKHCPDQALEVRSRAFMRSVLS
jgi:radical SAM protein with 4Fe4S-binding SPASM domain